MFDLVIDPDGFFDRQRERSGLLRPALVVASAGFASVGSPLVVLNTLVDTLGSGAGYFLVGYGIGLIGAVFGPFVEWILFSLGFFALSSRFGGEGSIRRVFGLVGWGFVPVTGAGLLMTVATERAVSRIAPPGNPEQVMAYVNLVQGDPTVRTAVVLGIVFSIWSGLLWVFAVKHARSLSNRQAVPTVAVPLAVSIGWRLFNLL